MYDDVEVRFRSSKSQMWGDLVKDQQPALVSVDDVAKVAAEYEGYEIRWNRPGSLQGHYVPSQGWCRE